MVQMNTFMALQNAFMKDTHLHTYDSAHTIRLVGKSII